MKKSKVYIGEVAEGIPFDNSTNGFIAKEVQSAIEEAKSSITGNDLTSMQFGITNAIAHTTFLYNIFQIKSDKSPTCVAYSSLLKRLSFFNSNNSGNFTINIYKFKSNSDPDVPGNRTLVYSESFNGFSGYTAIDQNVFIEAGYGIGVEIQPTGAKTKPADITVTIWSRQL